MSLSDFSRAAYQYGPFFFSAVLALFLLPRAAKEFKAATKRQGLSPADHWIFGAYFLATFAFLIGMISFSTWWWAGHQPIYVVSGAIHKLNAVGIWSPDPMYFKKQYDPSVPGMAPTYDVNFLPIRRRSHSATGPSRSGIESLTTQVLASLTTSVFRSRGMAPTTTSTPASTTRAA